MSTTTVPLFLIKAEARLQDPMVQRAARLWPDSPTNQREWLRAVGVVRRTRRGWLLDQPVTNKETTK